MVFLLLLKEEATCYTLHLYSQIVGKIKLATHQG